ncbi:hypothetical protein AYJ54_08255 [Bradyrhizobium centrolobii]|uniref:Uncharacterized protein n=1 Tax=Bradyrhizobium centrolobii TaxID=1505087 RepID=A0A176YVV4_9BRAD|nr:hypothetical protein AYJ54_08255 [Bradyrhizobium centrolobii]
MRHVVALVETRAQERPGAGGTRGPCCAKTPSATCRSREDLLTVKPPCNAGSRPTLSRPPHPDPRFVTIAIRSL